MAGFSEIKITFSQDLVIGAKFGFQSISHSSISGIFPQITPYNYFFKWVNLRSSNGEVSIGNPTSIPGERAAINFIEAFNLDYLAFVSTTTRNANEVIIRIQNIYGYTDFLWSQIISSFDYINNVFVTSLVNDPSINVVIKNSTSDFVFSSIVFSASETPCKTIIVTATTSQLANNILQPNQVIGNFYNPIILEVVRGVDFTLEIENLIYGIIRELIIVPTVLNINNFNIGILNTPNGSSILITNQNTSDLILEYSLDGITWQLNNSFSGLPDANYTLHVRDNYGCSFTKLFSVSADASYNPFFYISKSNSLRFAKRVDFNTNYKNDENTLSCEVECDLVYKEVQLFQSNDVVQTQFKSNYTLNIAKVVKSDLSEITIPVIKKTQNLNQKDKRDAIISANGINTYVHFTAGNVYDYATNAVTGTYALNGSLPVWAKVGNYININGSWNLIEDILFDENLNSDVIVFYGIYLQPTANVIVSCIFNIEEYEVYEFSIDMVNYIDQNIRVKIICSHNLFLDLIHLSEQINVKVKQLNTAEIKYKNETNTDVFYSTGIQPLIRQTINFINAINEQSSEKYKTDTNVVLLNADIYEGDEYIFEPVTKELMRKIIRALSHETIFIDNVGYVKNDAVEVEGPLGETNLYTIKCKMLKNGNVYNSQNSGISTEIYNGGNLNIVGLLDSGGGFVKY